MGKLEKTQYIWKNGEFIEWDHAHVHVLTHALHYGTAVFEGIRAYETPKGAATFRVNEHYERLIDSATIYGMPCPYTVETLIEANQTLLKKNNLTSAYIRPLLYYGYGEMGLNPANNPVDLIIAAWRWGTYLGDEGLEKGIRCKISSWARVDSHSLPPLAKCTANYANSVLAKQEALACGFDEAILLSTNGTIAEGPGENLFVIKNGQLITPPCSDNALRGITAQTVISLAADMNIPVVQQSLIRDELFLADELFFTGTAAEITPIREIDGRIIRSQGRGAITKRIQTAYFETVRGALPDTHHWLTY